MITVLVNFLNQAPRKVLGGVLVLVAGFILYLSISSFAGIFAGDDNPVVKAAELLQQAEQAIENNQLDDALDYTQQAAVLARELADAELVVKVLVRQADIYRAQGKHTEAAKLLKSAYTAATKRRQPLWQAKALQAMARHYQHLGNANLASQAALRAARLYNGQQALAEGNQVLVETALGLASPNNGAVVTTLARAAMPYLQQRNDSLTIARLLLATGVSTKQSNPSLSFESLDKARNLFLSLNLREEAEQAIMALRAVTGSPEDNDRD